MFDDINALHTALIQQEPKRFVSHHIFEPVPFAFAEDPPNWIEWKTHLAELLDVDPKDIVLTGSAAIGYSLNPHKNFREFGEKSDIDCGIISSHYFDISWRYLRQLRTSWLSLSSRTRHAISVHRRNYVFAGTIAADTILELLPFGQKWLQALDEMAQVAPTIGRQVKLRIYKDYDSLRYYQSANIEKIRIQLIESDVIVDPDVDQDVTEIPLED